MSLTEVKLFSFVSMKRFFTYRKWQQLRIIIINWKLNWAWPFMARKTFFFESSDFYIVKSELFGCNLCQGLTRWIAILTLDSSCRLRLIAVRRSCESRVAVWPTTDIAMCVCYHLSDWWSAVFHKVTSLFTFSIWTLGRGTGPGWFLLPPLLFHFLKFDFYFILPSDS